jgi:predicted nucleic acid-binding protein
MNVHVRDCLVTDYEELIGTLTLPDPDDRHVFAAAIKGQANVIVTHNPVNWVKALNSLNGRMTATDAHGCLYSVTSHRYVEPMV